MELLLLTRTERVALLCVVTALVYASPLLLPSSSSSAPLLSLREQDALRAHVSNDGDSIATSYTDALGTSTVDTMTSAMTTTAAAWDFLHLYDDRTNFHLNPVLQVSGDSSSSTDNNSTNTKSKTKNKNKSLFSWRNLLAMATMRRINVYEPLGWLLKALVVQLAGMDSWAIRVATLALHLCAGCVLAYASALLLDVNDLAREVATTARATASHEAERAYEMAEMSKTPIDVTMMQTETASASPQVRAFVPTAPLAVAPLAAERLAARLAEPEPRLRTRPSDDKSHNASWRHYRARQQQQQHYRLGCCLSALLFVVHPMHVEVVGWPSAQPYALAALFAYVSLSVYLRKVALVLQQFASPLASRPQPETPQPEPQRSLSQQYLSSMGSGLETHDCVVAGAHYV